MVEVTVRNGNVEQATKVLRKKLQKEGVFREMKRRKHFEKPSEIRKRRLNEAVRRQRKLDRKRRRSRGY